MPVMLWYDKKKAFSLSVLRRNNNQDKLIFMIQVLNYDAIKLGYTMTHESHVF